MSPCSPRPRKRGGAPQFRHKSPITDHFSLLTPPSLPPRCAALSALPALARSLRLSHWRPLVRHYALLPGHACSQVAIRSKRSRPEKSSLLFPRLRLGSPLAIDQPLAGSPVDTKD